MATKRNRQRSRKDDELETLHEASDRRLEAIAREMRELAARLEERTRLARLARR